MCAICPNEFGERLKNVIKSSSITQKELAEKIGVSKTSINNYVNGRIPDVAILYSLSSFLGVTIEWLLTGKELKETPKMDGIKWLEELNEADLCELKTIFEFLKFRKEK